jgi:hypothetical protein
MCGDVINGLFYILLVTKVSGLLLPFPLLCKQQIIMW